MAERLSDRTATADRPSRNRPVDVDLADADDPAFAQQRPTDRQSESCSPTASAERTGSYAIDLGELEYLQVLDPQGNVVDDREPDLSDEELMRVYRAMVLSRTLDQRMLNMQRQGQMGTFAPGIGQEAIQIGQVYWLQSDLDWYSPSYRSFGAQLWRGWTIEGLLLLWAGYFEGFEIPEGVNDLPFSIVIGSHVPVASGIAMGIRLRHDPGVVAVNFGDGASSQGGVSEAMNFASVYRAPIIFHLENNGYAISVRAEHQAAVAELARRGPAFGMPAIRVDGNDILASIVANKLAVDHARAGNGPYLIESVTYRMGVHTTADDPKVYRDDAEVEAWKTKCPILRFERYLTRKGVLDEEGIERIRQECEQEVLECRDRFRQRAKAKPREIFDFMFDELPPELQRQKEEFLRKLERKGVE